MSRNYTRPVQMTDEEEQALLDYAADHGRNWKQALANDWLYARRSGPLQYLRNAAWFGPTGLQNYRLPRNAPRSVAGFAAWSTKRPYETTDGRNHETLENAIEKASTYIGSFPEVIWRCGKPCYVLLPDGSHDYFERFTDSELKKLGLAGFGDAAASLEVSAAAIHLFESALERIESASIRKWATSAHNQPIWLQIAADAVAKGKTDPDWFAASMIIEAMGL